eukprot:1166468-Rhodomonas_salina.1
MDAAGYARQPGGSVRSGGTPGSRATFDSPFVPPSSASQLKPASRLTPDYNRSYTPSATEVEPFSDEQIEVLESQLAYLKESSAALRELGDKVWGDRADSLCKLGTGIHVP